MFAKQKKCLMYKLKYIPRIKSFIIFALNPEIYFRFTVPISMTRARTSRSLMQDCQNSGLPLVKLYRINQPKTQN